MDTLGALALTYLGSLGQERPLARHGNREAGYIAAGNRYLGSLSILLSHCIPCDTDSSNKANERLRPHGAPSGRLTLHFGALISELPRLGDLSDLKGRWTENTLLNYYYDYSYYELPRLSYAPWRPGPR